MAKCKPSLPVQRFPIDSLNRALDAIRVSTELIEEELRPHLDVLLTIVQDRKRGTPEQVVISGILPVLAHTFQSKGPLTLISARLVAELARELRKRFGEAGLVSALLCVLSCGDEEVLLYAGLAIARMSYESHAHQEQLLRQGVMPRLAGVLLRCHGNKDLEQVCLLALCNLGDVGEGEEAGLVWERGVSLRPGESLFRGVSPHSCSFSSTVVMVKLSQWASDQFAVSIEVLQRCSSSFWNVHRKKHSVRRFPLTNLSSCPKLYKVIKYSVQNVPKNRSLKTRVFHTFL
ncbi:rap1 GTPase-GDP dissociation stimulator 1 isoform X2 [Osmerus eperlanus]|uniref:rap1 GTPase-GDP dissociation stimulator 1 isoform X2 n=1 Tax=Osmerus eperlanus TaxID=29151 RepID=UPI002E112D4B